VQNPFPLDDDGSRDCSQKLICSSCFTVYQSNFPCCSPPPCMSSVSLPLYAMSDAIIQYNVGGILYHTHSQTLQREDSSNQLLTLAKQRTGTDEPIFIDRDGKLFSYILNYLRSVESGEEFILPSNPSQLLQLYNEAKYYKFINLTKILSNHIHNKIHSTSPAASVATASSAAENKVRDIEDTFLSCPQCFFSHPIYYNSSFPLNDNNSPEISTAISLIPALKQRCLCKEFAQQVTINNGNSGKEFLSPADCAHSAVKLNDTINTPRSSNNNNNSIQSPLSIPSVHRVLSSGHSARASIDLSRYLQADGSYLNIPIKHRNMDSSKNYYSWDEIKLHNTKTDCW
jgi:hypothetical protein